MTRRIYEQDAYCRAFEATVLSCVEREDGYAVELDATAFFPEGGGQLSDVGRLADAAVTDVQIVDERIWHYTDAMLSVGETVRGEIDWRLRFQRMQKHTGEHIVSGIVHRLYGYDNVGFHLGSEDVTLDFDGELSRDQLNEVEHLANEAVWANVAVTAQSYANDAVASLTYRSKKAIEGDVRLVTIDGYDVCACCAPHVARTGEIGMIKLLDAIRYKGGMRIHMQCGADALADYRMRYEQTAATAAALSVKQNEVQTAVDRLMSQLDEKNRQIKALKRRIALFAADAVPTTDDTVCVIIEPSDMETVQEMVQAIASRCGGVCAVFAGDDADGYQYVIMGRGDLPAVSQALRTQLGARGGGSAQRVQGRVQASADAIRSFFDNPSNFQ